MAKYNLIEIDPNLIEIDPKNPRGETEEQIEADTEFVRLKDSIHEYGVLVPLIVRKHTSKSGKYVLIDGERRLRASWGTNQKTVPVHIVQQGETSSETLIRAFQIHMLRKQWSKIAQARSLKMIIEKIKAEKECPKSELFERLQERTGYTETSLKDLMRVLEYPDSILEETEDEKSVLKFSHLVQIEASFIEPLNRTFDDLVKEFGEKYIRDKLINKIRKGVLYATMDLMENILPLFSLAKDSVKKPFIKGLLHDFIETEEMAAIEVIKFFEQKYPLQRKDLIDSVKEVDIKLAQVKQTLQLLDYTELKAFANLRKELRDSLKSFKGYVEKVMQKLK